MLKFLRRLIASPSPSAAGPTTSEPRQLTTAQRSSLSGLADIVYRHLPPQAVTVATKTLADVYTSGESLWVALLAADEASGNPTYLNVDVRDSASAVDLARGIAHAHGFNDEVAGDADAIVPDILRAFDALLSRHGYRFVQNRSVDWGYAGLVVQQENVDTLVRLAEQLDQAFMPGCTD